jgi:hypothetical protein
MTWAYCETCGGVEVGNTGEAFVVVGFVPGKAWRVSQAALRIGEDGTTGVEIPEDEQPELVDTMIPDARRTCSCHE